MPSLRLSPRLAYALLMALLVAYIVFQGRVALHLHAVFVTSADDLSNIDQAVWNSQHGRILQRTDGTRSVLIEHVEPIWIALGTLYHLWDDVRALLLAQTVALALGAVPVFWLARDVWGEENGKLKGKRQKAKGKSDDIPLPAPRSPLPASYTPHSTPHTPHRDYGAGLTFATVYLLSPFVGRSNSTEVHALPFAIAPLLAGVYWGWRGRWGRVWPLALLVLLAREDAGLLVTALGGWALVARRRGREGAALVALGAAAFGVMAFGVAAAFAAQRFEGTQAESIYFDRYALFGDGLAGMVWGMATRWDVWAELLNHPLRLTFGRELVGSTGGLMLFSPLSWLLFLPHLVLNLLSDYFAQFGGLQHYGAPLVPGAMVAAIFGGARLLRWGQGHPLVRAALLLLALAGAGWTIRHAIWQPLALSWIPLPETAHHRLLREIVAPIPPRAPLSADPKMNPHLAHRPDAYRFPALGENAEWVIADVTSNTSQHPADLRRDLLALLDSDWGIADAHDGYLLLRRGATQKTLPPAFFSFGRPTAPPAAPLRARFGDLLEVRGYTIEQDFWGRVAVQWHLRPLAPLPPTLTLDAALLDADGRPLPDTAGQPLTLLVWLPPEQWQPGESRLVRTLPRDAPRPFFPALSAQLGGAPLPLTIEAEHTSSLRPAPVGEWLAAGEWRLANNHAERGEQGWRQQGPPVALTQPMGHWKHARLGGWEVAREGQTVRVTLHWQGTYTGDDTPQRFLHLVPANGPSVPLAQADGPLGGGYRRALWVADEWVSETLTLPIPPDAPADLRLLVGLYDLASGQRHGVQPDAGGATFDLGRVR